MPSEAGRAIELCIVHNNEQDRLAYLRPRIAELSAALGASGVAVHVSDIGPHVSGMAGKVPRDTPLNRVRRALETAYIEHALEKRDPSRSTVRGLARRASSIVDGVRNRARSLRIEQEVLYAHAVAWRIAAREGVPVLVLESDAIVPPAAIAQCVGLIGYLVREPGLAGRAVYADLAGGCRQEDVANSWAFEPRHGCRGIMPTGVDGVEVLSLPTLTTNTVAGYYVSPALAAEFCRLMDAWKPMVAPDWAINRFAVQSEVVANAVCIHSRPTILSQGSFDGSYVSTIERRSRGAAA